MSLSPIDLLHFTYRSLRGNPVRSILTTVGVFMGVTAVSATLQVGSISRAIVARRLAARQAPQVTLFPEWRSPSGVRAQLKQDDMEFLQQRLVGVEAISAVNWNRSMPVVFQGQQAQPDIIAVSQAYLQTSGQSIVAGRFFTGADFAHFRPVVVIDELLATELFQAQNPIGQRIYASRQPYTVIGVIASKNNYDEEQPTGQLILTLTFLSALTGSREIDSFRIRPTQLQDLEAVGDRAEKLLMQRFPGQQFYQFNNVEDILEQQRLLELTSRGLAVVGAISLLVGGIGIANIMIASVTERTAEIGLRRAIGATRIEILLQFILEAALLSLVGGTVAIATVHGLTLVVSKQFNLPYRFEIATAGLTLAAAFGVGIGASLLPAIRASQLDPVQALRSQ
ncbi:ABC transporter permease [Microcoleus sp. FACHB-1515]|uniref:ABC transporter permease n=1 Tax=Cyanophyceae TaxID=3028117 RepID=UPI001685DC6E|nr:ABC transporter permease [Microcoleus sp. FACHB-1515]MBD2091321.1 ABC transporter permease [Microcoleus sp. FACHB-1515]